MSNRDLDWLAAQRPQRSGADPEAHDRALLALMRHASSRPGGGRRVGALNVARRPRPRLLPVATGVGLAAIAAAVVLSATGGTGAPAAGGPSSTRAPQAVATHHSPRSSLLRLADDLSTTTTGTGDATLIQRTTHIGGQDVTVFDLYGDNGTYYFSRDESGMPAQVSGDNSQGGGLFAREIAAAKQAATGNVAQAAIAMANAPDPNRNPLVTPQNSAVTPQAVAAAKLKAKLIGAQYTEPVSSFDNWAWEDSQDAIIAGAGDPQVRAGVLQILATLPGVTVTHGSAGGQPTLVLTAGADEVGSGYQEQLTVNAETGMPVGFIGGKPNGAPATQVDYRVARVNLADVAAGKLPAF